MTRETQIDISIIVVNFNTRDLLRDCLASVAAERRYLACEVFIVDNGSKDGSSEMAARKFSWVRLIRNTQNVGFAGPTPPF